MESFDVVIVGAGPAGLRCAETLGGTNLRVLLLEKNKEIGSKVCAGGLTWKDIELLNLPKELIDFQYNNVKIHVNDICSHLKHDKDFVFTVDRKRLGQWQLSKLKNFKNIVVQMKSEVTGIDKNYVTVNGKKIGYKYMVGADGPGSIVRKYLGLKSDKVGIGIQYIIPTKKFKDFEIFFEPKLFSVWFAWIFPHKCYASIGCGYNLNTISSKQIKKNFELWLRKKNIDVSKGTFETYTIGYDFQEYRFDNVFLVGDAGGFVSGFTGKGIYPALITGEETAKMILDPNHVPKKIEKVLEIKRFHEKTIRLLIKAGKLKTPLFHLGRLMLFIPQYRKKTIEIYA